MEHPEHSPEPGAEISGYRLQALIARGSMGVIYRALDIRLGRPVALRLLAPELSANEEFSQRFVRESRLAASVDHPNILPVYGAGEWSGLLYAAMRYVPGTDLQAELDRLGTLPLPEALRILSDTAAALDAAHAAGLVHGDVKPSNILLSDGSVDVHRHVYVADFGLNQHLRSAPGATAPGPVLGTVDFLAPEQVRGEGADDLADVYALACVAYTLLAGHPPFDHEDDSVVLRAHLAEEPPHLAKERPEVPAAVEMAILRGMAKKREDRPSTCGALVTMMSGGAAAGDVPLRPGDSGAPTEPGSEAPEDDDDDGTRTAAGQTADAVTAAGLDPHRGPHGSSRHREAGRRRGLIRRVAVLGAVLLVLLTIGLLLPRVLSGDQRVSFRADGVPYTLEVPQSWTKRTHEAGDSTVSVLSEADLTALFADDPDAPAAVSRSAVDDPDSVVGLAIYHRPAGLGGQATGARIDTAEALLPGREAYLVDRGETVVGDLEGQLMEGSMQLPAATLQVSVIVLDTEPVQLLVFFAPSSLFQERTEVFDEVAGSLRRIE